MNRRALLIIELLAVALLIYGLMACNRQRQRQAPPDLKRRCDSITSVCASQAYHLQQDSITLLHYQTCFYRFNAITKGYQEAINNVVNATKETH